MLASEAMDHSHALRLGFCEHMAIASGILISSHPKFADAKISQHRRHPAEMIFMRMRHHDRIDAFESARPEEWRDDIFAHVEPRPHPAHIIGAGQTSGI